MINASITSFTGGHRYLSNFYIEPDGTHVEGEYQRAKCANVEDRIEFNGLTPGQAKRLGKRVKLRENWDKVKIAVMYELVWAKFSDHGMLREALVATANRELVEGNNYGDVYWGKVDGVGDNHLGRILMTVRNQLKQAWH